MNNLQFCWQIIYISYLYYKAENTLLIRTLRIFQVGFCPFEIFSIRIFFYFRIFSVLDFHRSGFCPIWDFIQFGIMSMRDFVQFRIMSVLDFVLSGILSNLRFCPFGILYRILNMYVKKIPLSTKLRWSFYFFSCFLEIACYR